MADSGFWDSGPDPTTTGTASPSHTGTAGRYGTPGDDGFASDLFRDKFMNLATGGSAGEKLLRGFLVGLAIGLVVACFVCCWYPCCRGRGRRRRTERQRRFRRPRWMSNRPDEEAIASGAAGNPDPELAEVTGDAAGTNRQGDGAIGNDSQAENQTPQETGLVTNSNPQNGPAATTETLVEPNADTNSGTPPGTGPGTAARRSEENRAQG